jgi:hypothetical protein
MTKATLGPAGVLSVIVQVVKYLNILPIIGRAFLYGQHITRI